MANDQEDGDQWVAADPLREPDWLGWRLSYYLSGAFRWFLAVGWLVVIGMIAAPVIVHVLYGMQAPGKLAAKHLVMSSFQQISYIESYGWLATLTTFASVGAALARLAVAHREGSHRKIRVPEDLDALPNAVSLGAIPEQAKMVLAEAFGNTGSEVREACFAVLANLQFSSGGALPRAVMVTSADKAEGKSTMATGLAACAATKARTILIEADLRRPHLGRAFGLHSRVGTASVLAKGDWEGAVGRAEPLGFDLMPAGYIPKEPVALLLGGFAQLLANACEKYEFVVIDAPPVLRLADALILANHTKNVLFAVSSGQTGRRASRAMELLQMPDGDCPCVLTRFRARDFSYGYGHSYDYSPNYGVVNDKSTT